MDIDEYLKKKKELEHKKDHLESQKKSDKKKYDHSKKEVEIKRKREITHVPNEPHSPHRGHSGPSYHHGGNDNIRWIFLGLAFFVALIIIGIFFVSRIMVPGTVTTENDNGVDELQKKLDELQKTINESQNEDTIIEEETNETNETVITIGPEFKLYLVDEHEDINSLGTFDSSGKVGGNLIQIWTGGGSATYRYRVYVENEELTEIQCKLDKKTEIDEDQDGEIDETDYHLDRYILEMAQGDEEELNDAVSGIGKITMEYEARCYFCETSSCDNVFYSGETLETAKLRIIIHDTELNNSA
ncbi:hypothetical protein HOF78_02105 [Candidatus Woesearchaeota archaeon]|jgi:hypothetical protein|nr:hypothetical protein [Candidatus Woesearchaeota archaeon]MBT6401942.1 hypothetical protein [Candidatus Woesearchaeota archaeon]